jgi:DNA polymerase-3 subunit alpha
VFLLLDFVHLHLHTGYSLADSSLKPKQLAKKVKELGMKSVAITDHGSMFGVIEFYKACQNEGIKPILGVETYVAPRTNRQKEGSDDNANYHLVLLAENEEGYHNLIEIASDASLNGFYYKPRTDKTRLKRFSKGLIALSACLGGEVQELIQNCRYEEAKYAALYYDEIFGRGNFYLELQNHSLVEQANVNHHLLRLSREIGIPLVCTNDCHYLDQKDAKAHDVLMAIQAKTTIYDTKRKVYNSDQFYLKSPEEMFKLFAHIPEAIENTVKIAERCNVTLEFGKNKLPRFYAPEGFTNYDYLKKLAYEGAEKLYPEVTQEIAERIEYELEVVNKMGFIDYFLITWDFIRYSRENGILTGPGRGSGAGSILLYCLWITRIDPLRYGLLFERFLDPSRISMPDCIYSRACWKQQVLSFVNSITQRCVLKF